MVANLRLPILFVIAGITSFLFGRFVVEKQVDHYVPFQYDYGSDRTFFLTKPVN